MAEAIHTRLELGTNLEPQEARSGHSFVTRGENAVAGLHNLLEPGVA